ncbi:MAG: serine/threonine protein kinase, partial [Thermoguttaceae bacterium]|nr:serine/threonine protein kinase [Thermoguttaceae bacterium]
MAELDAEDREPLEVLAEEFVQRQRAGEHPSIAEYAARHPELASEIEELFPTIAAMERLRAHREGSQSGRVSLGGVRLERLGDFRILGEIGRGGMGIVYEAFQETLGRHVAVKVLPRQALLDPKQLQRFQREARTAARLHHTNIVPLFGVGQQEGFHYLVMQLIRGVGLDVVIARIQKLLGQGAVGTGIDQPPKPLPPGAASPSDAEQLARLLVEGSLWRAGDSGSASEHGLGRRLLAEARGEGPATPSCGGTATEDYDVPRQAETAEATPTTDRPAPQIAVEPSTCQLGPPYWRSVAAIGIQAADALHYAHCHHTLHRDIKPANLLLDAQGVVWITDFGLAKALDEDQGSQTGTLAGTLRYMAPEQFSGQVDARSDIYSLGLSLYELITLRPAFVDTSRSVLIHKITHEQPPRPRQLNPAVPRDLETIVLKAMAREPADRYQSAAELARDLERFLDDRPISARRVSPAERLWRWSRRNPAVAGLAASTMALLVLVTLVASVGYVRIREANIEEQRQREIAHAISVEEQRQRQKADATSALALEALDNIFRQFAPDRTPSPSSLNLVSESGDEIAVPVQPVLSKEAAAILEQMLVFYDRLAKQGGNDARLRRKIAEANRRVGDIRQRLGHYGEAKAAYLRAIELYKQLARDAGGDTELTLEIARILNELGNVGNLGR